MNDATDIAAEEPREPKRGPLRLISRTLRRSWDGSIFAEAAEAAFWQALSLAPLMLGLLGMLGYVGDWLGRGVTTSAKDEIVSFTETVFSPTVVSNIVEPTVNDMLTEGKAAIASVGFLIALWAGSSAMASFVDAITAAHDQHRVRNEIWQRFFALLLYVLSLALLIVGLPLIAIGPDLLPQFVAPEWRDTVDAWVRILYYPTVGAVLVLALTLLYKVSLPRKLPWHRGIPGAILAMAIFLLTSSGLRLYLANITATGYTYGALATFVAFLLFLYFIGLAIIGGAYFNSAIEELWPAKPTRRQRRRWRRLELERANEELRAQRDTLWQRTTRPLRRPKADTDEGVGGAEVDGQGSVFGTADGPEDTADDRRGSQRTDTGGAADSPTERRQEGSGPTADTGQRVKRGRSEGAPQEPGHRPTSPTPQERPSAQSSSPPRGMPS